MITGTLSFRACEAHTYLATFFVSFLLASYKSTYSLSLSPAWWSAFQDLFYCHRDSSGAMCRAGLQCGRNMRAPDPNLRERNNCHGQGQGLTQNPDSKMINCECQLALLCVVPYISICLLQEEKAMIEICLSITAEK